MRSTKSPVQGNGAGPGDPAVGGRLRAGSTRQSLRPQIRGAAENSAPFLRWRTAPRGIACLAAVLAPLVFAGSRAAAEPARPLLVDLEDARDNRVCFGCHGRSGGAHRQGRRDDGSLTVNSTAYRASAHGERACTDCHEDVTTIPHTGVHKVRCGRCHPVGDERVAAKHGKRAVSESVHDRAVRRGNANAPGCAACHGTHDITGPKAVGSRVSRASVPATCGRCHLEEYTQYRVSTHGDAVARGNLDAAVCTDCHGEHTGMLPKEDPSSRIYPLRVPDTCSKCHESARLMKRYGLPPARQATYRDSYHGIAAKFGDLSAANCASCHGFHDILPSTDPKSRVHRANLPTTCGACHVGATANFARGTIHLMPSPEHDAPVYWVRLFYRAFIFGLMGQFVGLIGLDLLARRREARRRGDRR